MNPLEELKLLAESLVIATDFEPNFFALVTLYIKRLHGVLAEPRKGLTMDELQMLARKLDDFWKDYRPRRGFPYMPPRPASTTDKIVREIGTVVSRLGQLGPEPWQALLSSFIESQALRNPADASGNTSAMEDVKRLCSRFHLVAIQLRRRREGRPTLGVDDEYDVQDLMHSLLRLYFDDIRPEEWTPSYAGKSTRMDFLLKEQNFVIEVKKTRIGLGVKEVGEQLIVDIAHYATHSNCKTLVCFVYDPENRIINPRGLESDLSRVDNTLIVAVFVVPKHV